MTRLELGAKPADLVLNLAWGGGWVQPFTVQGTPLNEDDQVVLKFYAANDEDAPVLATWTAVMSDPQNGRWEQTPADVLAVLHADAKVVRLQCVKASGVAIVWGAGRYSKE